MKIGNRDFCGDTYVMAIVNLTPDSFYSSSRAMGDEALFAVERAIKEGASVIDLGPQSTRPGHSPVSSEEEWKRLSSPLKKIKERFDIPVSVDTYYSMTASLALSEGADMINDVWGLTYDADMAKVIAKYDASVCIMHNAKELLKGDIFCDILDFLRRSVSYALQSGIDKQKICLDGGIGFAKDREQNFELLNGYERLSILGYSTLLGCSRKSMFGGDVNDRLAPTLEATKAAVKKGVLFVRVHDVKENVKAIAEAKEER